MRLLCAGGGDPHAHAGAVARAALPHIGAADLIIVQGDTSSALGGALAAAQAAVPIAHVEAGLRSHDPRAPWPEEEFRVAIDSLADLLFAPTGLSAANLRREGVKGEIRVTGNTAIDALLATAAGEPSPRPAGRRPRLLVTCHRRESWGDAIRGIALAVRELTGSADIRLVLHPNPEVAATMRQMLEEGPSLALLPPCDHARMLAEMRDSDLILSDSGGMQEEAPALGVPLLVLRDRTERPEGIASGNLELVGTDPRRIVVAVQRLLCDAKALAAMRTPGLPYGDGRASEAIAGSVEDWLARRGLAGIPTEPVAVAAGAIHSGGM